MKKRRKNHPADQPAAWDAIALRIAKISADGGGGRTVEIGGRDTPLMQLLEHTLSLVLQLCMH